MPDPRFFPAPQPVPVGVLAEQLGAELADGEHGDRLVKGLSALSSAGSDDLSFLHNPKYVADLKATGAGAIILASNMRDKAPAGAALLLSAEPYRAWARATQLFYPAPPVRPGLATDCRIDASATVGDGTRVDAGAVIEAGAQVGARCRVHANAVIGPNVVIGDDCVIGACASLTHCIVGNRVTLLPGARVGQDGFGFAMSARGHEKIVQLGRVIIEDDVEIGANTTVDRGSGPDTVIGAGTKIDNLVQIAHNVVIGRDCVLSGQSGVAGSTRIEKLAALGAQSGIAGHLVVGAGARIGAKSGVMRDVPPGAELFGLPARPLKQFFRLVVLWERQLRARRPGK